MRVFKRFYVKYRNDIDVFDHGKRMSSAEVPMVVIILSMFIK